MEIIISWIILSFVVGAVAANRTTGFLGGFLISLLLSPLIGIIVTLASKRKDTIAFEKALLEKNEYKNNVNYIDELFKLKSLLDSGAITNELFESEKLRLDRNRAEVRNLYFFDSKGRSFTIHVNNRGKSIKVKNSITNAERFTINESEFILTVIPSNIFLGNRSFKLNALDIENTYDLADIIK